MGVEAGIQADVVEYARSYSIVAKKMAEGEGWPDYMFLFMGRILFIEFKAPGEGPTPKQREMMRILVHNRFDVRVCSDVEEGKTILFNHFQLWKSQPGETQQST